MRKNSKLLIYYIVFVIIGILSLDIYFNFQLLINRDNPNDEDLLSIKSNQSTTTIYEWTPYGSVAASSTLQDPNEQNYFEWSISTLYGPGFTWYMMNDSEFWDMAALKSTWRTRENLSYTALLSDEEVSDSGTFYPQYSDTWWFVSINHYTGFNCSVAFTHFWKDDFITVEEPTDSSSWEKNSYHYINWTWGGDFAYVNIDLYYDGNFLRNIATNTQNNGSYLWRIPSDLSINDDLYQINITNSEFGATWGISNGYFDIFNKSISIISPSTSNLWEKRTINSIIWTSIGTISDVKIELFKDDNFEFEIISNTPNDGEYYWTIPLMVDTSTQYQIKISDVSDPSIYKFSDYFEIYPPSINITVPDNFSSWESGTSHNIYWVSTNSITDVKLELYKDGIFVMEITSDTPNDGLFSWIVPSKLDNSTQYQIRIIDLFNSSIYDFSDYFKISTAYRPSRPSEIPSYDLIILFSTSIVIALLIFISRKKKVKIIASS